MERGPKRILDETISNAHYDFDLVSLRAMFYATRIPYKTFSWSAPKLQPAEEIEVGREIARVGKEPFVREFLKPPPKPAPSPAKTNNAHGETIVGPGTPPGFVMVMNNHKMIAADKTLAKAPFGPPKKHSTAATVASATGIAALAGAAIAINPAILIIAGVGVAYSGGITLGSRHIVTWKYKRWLDRCLAKYHMSQRNSPES